MATEKSMMNLIVPAPLNALGDKMALNPNRNSPFIKYQRDKLTVKYIGRGLAYPDVAVHPKLNFTEHTYTRPYKATYRQAQIHSSTTTRLRSTVQITAGKSLPALPCLIRLL